jgi:hypothetical protein
MELDATRGQVAGKNCILLAGTEVFTYMDSNVTIIRDVTRVVRQMSLWSCGQSFWLQIQSYRVRFPVLRDFLRRTFPGTWSSELSGNNCGGTSKKN